MSPGFIILTVILLYLVYLNVAISKEVGALRDQAMRGRNLHAEHESLRIRLDNLATHARDIGRDLRHILERPDIWGVTVMGVFADGGQGVKRVSRVPMSTFLSARGMDCVTLELTPQQGCMLESIHSWGGPWLIKSVRVGPYEQSICSEGLGEAGTVLPLPRTHCDVGNRITVTLVRPK